jgi:hypothetical protein
MAQYGHTMRRVGKTVPPKRAILKDISLSFFPGARKRGTRKRGTEHSFHGRNRGLFPEVIWLQHSV